MTDNDYLARAQAAAMGEPPSPEVAKHFLGSTAEDRRKGTMKAAEGDLAVLGPWHDFVLLE